MIRGLSLEKTIIISAGPPAVWDTLTNPEKIKKYLFGTETISTWKTGAPVIFQGEYQGQHYRDKGMILELRENEVFQYSYWSGFSGLEDREENYSIVTFRLKPAEGQSTILTLTQKGFASEAAREHTAENWNLVLDQIKEIAQDR